MKYDFLYFLGFFFVLLKETLAPIMPVHSAELADVFFLAYMATGMKSSKACVFWMAGALGFFTLSLLWSIDPVWGLWGIRQVFVLFIAMLATDCYLRRTPEGIKNLLKAYLIASGLLVVFLLSNWGQLEQGERLGAQMNESSDNQTLFNSNVFGLNLCYALFAGYILYLRGSKNKLTRLVVLVASALVLYIILMTGSRKALFTLIIPFIIIPLLGQKKSRLLLIIPIIIGSISVGIYLIMKTPVLYDVLGSRLEDMINIASDNVEGGEDVSRVFLIQYGLEWFQEKPFLGYGINNFRVLSDNTVMFAGRNFYAHNNYIELLVDVGIVGFIVYYSCYISFLKRLRHHSSDSYLNKWMVVLIIVSLFLDIGMVSYYTFTSNLVKNILFFVTGSIKQQGKYVKQTILK